jgi:hypothetical protein
MSKISSMAKNVYIHYIVIWSLLAIDLVLKILIMYGHPLLFDSIVTICTLAMRAKCNLLFGLELKTVLNIKTTTVKKSGKSLSSMRKESSASIKNAPRPSAVQMIRKETVGEVKSLEYEVPIIDEAAW